MTLLPAVVPEIPEARSGIVPARLARKIGPLFGIQWDGNGYGLTWVSDYSRLTLSEIARGAPAPTRAETARAAGDLAAGEWRLVDRAVVSHRPGSNKPEPLPNEIANATLNRFGPDTKAAVVLTGANALLEPVTTAISAAIAFLDRTSVGRLPDRIRVGAWASLVLEAFRSQPALFAAAVQAREIQRAALQGWKIPTIRERSCARSELGGSELRTAAGSPSSPVDFDVVDKTIQAVSLGTSSAGGQRNSLRASQLRLELTRRWLSRLVALGTVAGEGFLWLAEPVDGHRTVEAFAPHDPTLWSFLTELEPLLPATTDPMQGPAGVGSETFMATMPSIPRATDLQSLNLLTRRAVVLALTTLVRLAFNSGSPDPAGDLHTLATLDQLANLARDVLPSDDPVAAVTCCRTADMRLELLRQDAAHDADLGAAVDGLLAELEHCERLLDGQLLHAADVVELIRSACVELMTVLRRHQPDQLIPGVLAPAKLLRKLGELWRTMLEQMEIDLNRLHEQPLIIQRLIGYQLHDYVTYLGGNGTESDARAAVALYRDFVLPARQDYYRQSGYFQPLLYSYQNATRPTTRLASLAAAAGNQAEARAYAEQGRSWIWSALAEQYTTDMLERASSDATDEVCRFALLAVPALLGAVEHASAASDPADLNECEHLLEHARRFADRFAKRGTHYGRAAELVELTNQLERVREGRLAG